MLPRARRANGYLGRKYPSDFCRTPRPIVHAVPKGLKFLDRPTNPAFADFRIQRKAPEERKLEMFFLHIIKS